MPDTHVQTDLDTLPIRPYLYYTEVTKCFHIVYLWPSTSGFANKKNNPLEKIMYFSHGSTDLSQTFRLCI